MDYTKHYQRLVGRSPKISWNGEKKKQPPSWKYRDSLYREGHRIVPGCLGGKYISENVVYLTPEEHYVAHQLLMKMYPDHKSLVYAAYMMANAKNGGRRQSNKVYGWLRQRAVSLMKEQSKGQRRSPETEIKKGQRISPYTEFKKDQSSLNKGMINITNGDENRIHNPIYPIPPGWYRGQNKTKYTVSELVGTFERTPTTRAKMSASAKERINRIGNPMTSEESRRRVAESKMGRKWYHHPETKQVICVKPEDKPEGFVAGKKAS